MRNATLELSLAAFAAIAAPPRPRQPDNARSWVAALMWARARLLRRAGRSATRSAETLAGGEVIVLDSAGYRR